MTHIRSRAINLWSVSRSTISGGRIFSTALWRIGVKTLSNSFLAASYLPSSLLRIKCRYFLASCFGLRWVLIDMVGRSFSIIQQRPRVNCLQYIKRTLNTKTETNVGRNGPTAVVFMNMGGPSNQGEVRDFLHRLFVRLSKSTVRPSLYSDFVHQTSQMETSFRSEDSKSFLQT